MKFLATAFIVLFLVCIAKGENFGWKSFGANNHGTRNANDVGIMQTLNSANVHLLGIESVFHADGYITATPYVDGNVVIVPSSDGYLYCFHRNPLRVKWATYIPDVQEIEGDYSRTTPVRYKDNVIIGHHGGGYSSAFSYNTGEMVWSTQVHDHPLATITASATLRGDRLYFGVASLEELAAANPFYPCCSFVGKFVMLSAVDGTILNSFDLIQGDLPIGIPDGYSGVAAWGSQPVISERHNLVLFGTGNPYTVPASVESCQASNPSSDTCIDQGVFFNGVVALDLGTFEFKWYRRLSNYDAWTVACLFAGPNCPGEAGPDADFGMNGALIEGISVDGVKQDILMIAQKSGVMWNLNVQTGEVNCGVSTGPGGTLGGSSWGLSTDGKGVFSSNVNSGNICHYIYYPEYTQTFGGSWSRVDAATCSLTWTTPTPESVAVGEDDPNYNDLAFGSLATGPTVLINDLVIGTETSFKGSIVFMNKRNGEVIHIIDTGATIYGGVALYDNCLYVGNGYNPIYHSGFVDGNTFFEICVPENGIPV